MTPVADHSLQGEFEISIDWSIRIHIVILDEMRQSDFGGDVYVCVESDGFSIWKN